MVTSLHASSAVFAYLPFKLFKLAVSLSKVDKAGQFSF